MSDSFFLLPEDVAEIVAILDGTEYDHLDIKTRRFSLRIARSGGGWTQTWQHADDAGVTRGAEPDAAAGPTTEQPEEGVAFVRAPLPGVFYHAPRPGAPPFVGVGDTVSPDSVIGIIETMKVMNSVAAGVAGTIAEISATNGTQVEPEAILVRVRLA